MEGGVIMSWKSIICSVFLLLFAMQTLPVKAETVSDDHTNGRLTLNLNFCQIEVITRKGTGNT